MPTSQKILKLDVSAEQSYVYLKCKQYDENSRVYQIIPTDRHIPVVLNGDELVVAGMTKADNSYVDTICEWVDGKLYLTMTEAMLSTSGEGKLEIRIFKSDNATIISTMIVHVDVQSSAMPYDRMIASNEFNVLNNLLLSVQANIDAIEGAEELVSKIQEDITAYETEYGELSSEAKSLITDLKEQSNKIDISLANSETILDNANTTIQKLNEAIDNLVSIRPSVLSSTQPTSQDIGGLWFVENTDTNYVTSVAEKIANNGDENDYRYVNIGGSSASVEVPDVEWSTLLNKPFETIDENTLSVEDGTLKVIGGGSATTEITQAVNDIVTARAGEDIATKEEIINDNLLKNSNFKLNTNGLNEYVGADTYTVDGWRQFIDLNGSVKTSDNGIILDNTNGTVSFGQFLENSSAFAGKTVTLSARIMQLSEETSDGSIYIGGNNTPLADVLIEDKLTKDEWVTLSVTCTLPDELTNFNAVFYLGAKTQGQILVNWAKLELGSIATEYVEPDTEIEKVRCGVHDADTVDGYHMSDYFQYPITVIPNEADLNTYLTPGVYRCTTLTVAKTLLNAPAVISGFKLIVKNMVGSTNLIQYAECVGKIFFRTLTTDLSNVQPWRSLDDYLPLTGGTITGEVLLGSGYGRLNSNTVASALASMNTPGEYLVNSRTLSINNSNGRTLDKCLYIRDLVNGTKTDYNVLHTGNSNPVAISSTAPTDTTALWAW